MNFHQWCKLDALSFELIFINFPHWGELDGREIFVTAWHARIIGSAQFCVIQCTANNNAADWWGLSVSRSTLRHAVDAPRVLILLGFSA